MQCISPAMVSGFQRFSPATINRHDTSHLRFAGDKVCLPAALNRVSYMEIVRCPAIVHVCQEEVYAVHQKLSSRLFWKTSRVAWTKVSNASHCLSLLKDTNYIQSKSERHKCICTRANGAAEFSTLSEQQTVDLDDKHVELVVVESQDLGTSKPETDKESALKGIFPGGLHRAEVRLPGLIMMVKVSDVLGPLAKDSLDKLDLAVAAGFTMVVLEAGSAADGDDSSSGARLYEGARLLKAALRGRAELLIADRVDITAAAGASGVLLYDDGLPAVVARSMLQNVNPDNSVLPLVARCVSSAESALLATASEGADFLILQGLNELDTKLVIDSIRERVSIPIFVQDAGGLQKGEEMDLPMLQAGANGFFYDSLALKNIPAGDVSGVVSSLVGNMSTVLQRRTSRMSKRLTPADAQGPSTRIATNLDTSRSSSLDVEFRTILEEERSLLTSMIKLLKAASPEVKFLFAIVFSFGLGVLTADSFANLRLSSKCLPVRKFLMLPEFIVP
ncbi:hypothetical protein L7F22_007806 [Adiantum nelumboides]|nr:hypothetical protein [Adiantum nelumboides]